MPTIYQAAIQNFRAASDMLTAILDTRTDALAEIRSALSSRPRLALADGYADVSPKLGACLPKGGRAEWSANENDTSLELRSSGTDWMTLEVLAPTEAESEITTAVVEAKLLVGRDQVIDLFLRDIFEDGTVRDTGHTTVQLKAGALTLGKLAIAERQEGCLSRRVILHLRQPAQRIVFEEIAVSFL